MSKRHNRDTFFIAAKGVLRGIVNRLATPSECERAFRFSEIVIGTSADPSDELLEALANIMTQNGSDIDSHIPAGFTYLGQFVDHDLTRDRTDVPFGAPVLDPGQLTQARSPALDLDSVYGMGPSIEPVFYESDGIHLKTGTTQASGPASLDIAKQSLPEFDLPRWGPLPPNLMRFEWP